MFRKAPPLGNPLCSPAESHFLPGTGPTRYTSERDDRDHLFLAVWVILIYTFSLPRAWELAEGETVSDPSLCLTSQGKAVRGSVY